MKVKRFYIEDPTNHFRWWVQRGGSAQQALDYVCEKEKLTKDLVSENPARRGCFMSHPDLKGGLLWFHKDSTLSEVAHEVTHAVSHLFRKMNCTLDKNCEEFFTYYTESLFKNITDNLWRKDLMRS